MTALQKQCHMLYSECWKQKHRNSGRHDLGPRECLASCHVTGELGLETVLGPWARSDRTNNVFTI